MNTPSSSSSAITTGLSGSDLDSLSAALAARMSLERPRSDPYLNAVNDLRLEVKQIKSLVAQGSNADGLTAFSPGSGGSPRVPGSVTQRDVVHSFSNYGKRPSSSLYVVKSMPWQGADRAKSGIRIVLSNKKRYILPEMHANGVKLISQIPNVMEQTLNWKLLGLRSHVSFKDGANCPDVTVYDCRLREDALLVCTRR
jgi:hypothetical protein